MSEKTDVLIVGGGIIGVCAAYYLARTGAGVTLLEKGELCAGSSYGNAGLIVPCHSKPIPGPGVLSQGVKWMLNPASPFYIKPRLDPDLLSWLWQFRAYCNEQAVRRAVPLLRDAQRASLALFREIITSEQIACHFEQAGGLEVFCTPGGFAEGQREFEMMSGFGLEMELKPPESLRALEPALGPNVSGGIHFKEDAHLNPALFVEGLALAAQKHGAVIRTQAGVLSIERQGSNLLARLHGGESLHANQVVLAAGSWSAGLARGLGLRIPLQPAKGYSLTMKRGSADPKIPLYLAEARLAVTPMGPNLRLAGTLEMAGLDQSISPRRVNAIPRAAAGYLAAFDPREEVETWSGLRPVAPDGLPFIGRSVRFPNLIVAAGHAMLGVSMGPVTGKLVSEIACGQEPSLDLSGFAVDRFSHKPSLFFGTARKLS